MLGVVNTISEETADGMAEAEQELERLAHTATTLTGLIDGLRQESAAALPA